LFAFYDMARRWWQGWVDSWYGMIMDGCLAYTQCIHASTFFIISSLNTHNIITLTVY